MIQQRDFKSDVLFILDELEITRNVDWTIVLIAYGIILAPLVFLYLLFRQPYLNAIKRNRDAYVKSSYIRLADDTYTMIKTTYLLVVVLGVVAASLSLIEKFKGAAVAIGIICLILFLVLYGYWSMYPMIISVLSIHRFLNRDNLEHLQHNLSQKNVGVIMALSAFVIILEHLGIAFWLIGAFVFGEYEIIKTIIMCFMIFNIVNQIFLFFGMVLQFCMKPADGHPEKVFGIHTKVIGIIKMILLVVAVISYFTGIESHTMILFFLLDVFIIPVVVQITEMRTEAIIVRPPGMNDDIRKTFHFFQPLR